MHRIVVCVKAVPDPKAAAKIKIDPVTKNLIRSNIPLVINPLDRNAVEAALRLKEAHEAHITVISMGPPAAGQVVKECLALGADQGILLSDRAFGGADAFATARTLAAAVGKCGDFDLVLCGMSSSDGATEWVGPEMSVFLNVPVVSMVSEIVEAGGDRWMVKAEIENGYRLVRVALPAVLTVARKMNEPRNLSFSGIIKARRKEITIWSAGDLNVPEDVLGLKGSPTIVTTMETAESRRSVEMIAGSRQEKAEQLLRKLVEAGVVC